MPLQVTVDQVPSTFFHTRKLDPSTENLRSIMNRRTWPSLSPVRAGAMAAESALMVRFYKENRLRDLVNTWRTRFLQRGLVLKDKNKPDEVVFSLGPWPTCAAALCISLRKATAADKSVWYSLPKPLTREHLQWKCVEKFADWEVVQTQLISPLHAGLLMKGSGAKKKNALVVPELPGMWREKTKTRLGLLKFSASMGFWDISNFYIKLLLQDWLPEALKPKTLNPKLA